MEGLALWSPGHAAMPPSVLIGSLSFWSLDRILQLPLTSFFFVVFCHFYVHHSSLCLRCLTDFTICMLSSEKSIQTDTKSNNPRSQRFRQRQRETEHEGTLNGFRRGH